MNVEKKILILGAAGMVGSALVRKFKSSGYQHILAPHRQELDLSNQEFCKKYFSQHQPDWIVMAAAKVGGIQANNVYRADFILQNLIIQNNVFESALQSKAEKFLFLGSSCIYPRNCPQPIKEEYLLTGELEPTNEPYAIAKIAGLKTAENIKRQYGRNFFSAMPTNLYGENDNYHRENSHVIPGLIARMQDVIDKNEKVFRIWGTGKPKREFLYVDDLALACQFLMEFQDELPHWINIGTGQEISILELSQLIARLMNYQGQIEHDLSKPDGMMLKRLDVTKINSLGWKASTCLEQGLTKAISLYRKSKQQRS